MQKELKSKALIIRLGKNMHKDLRKLSFLTEKSMSMLVTESIEEMLKKQNKVLTNTDSMI